MFGIGQAYPILYYPFYIQNVSKSRYYLLSIYLFLRPCRVDLGDPHGLARPYTLGLALEALLGVQSPPGVGVVRHPRVLPEFVRDLSLVKNAAGTEMCKICRILLYLS